MFHVEQSSKIDSFATILFTTGNYICKLGSCSLICFCLYHPSALALARGVLGSNPRRFAGAPPSESSVLPTFSALYGCFGSFYDYFGAVSPVCPVAHRLGSILLPTPPPAHHTASPALQRSTDWRAGCRWRSAGCAQRWQLPHPFGADYRARAFLNSLPLGTSSVRALRCLSSQT